MNEQFQEFTLWEQTGEAELYYVLETEKVSKAIDCMEGILEIDDVNADEVNMGQLDKQLQAYKKENPYFEARAADEMKEFFESIGLDKADPTLIDTYADIDELLIYDFNSEEFADKYCDEMFVKTYEYFDGNNYRTLRWQESETLVSVDPEYVDLDEYIRQYDPERAPKNEELLGCNEIYKVVETDGDCEKVFLLRSSGYSLPREGALLSRAELMEHLRNLNINVDACMNELDSIQTAV